MKAHELAKILLEGPDLEVEIEFASEWDYRDTQPAVSVFEQDNCMLISEHNAPSPEELKRSKEAAERAERLRQELEQAAIDRERELQERWGPLLP